MGERLPVQVHGGETTTTGAQSCKILYWVSRALLMAFALLLFLPSASPTHIILKSGQATIKGTASLFTSGISYGTLTDSLGRAFDKGWLNETYFYLLFAASIVTLLGVALAIVGGCMSVGNHRMKSVGNRFLLGGSGGMTIGMAQIYVSYCLITGSADTSKITFAMPIGFWIFAVLALAQLAVNAVIFFVVPKASKEEKMEMEPKFQLFLMLLPFLVLVLAFSYLPLTSWRYAFFDYSAGSTLSWDKFVGLKWFKTLVQNKAYIDKLLQVLRNTLVMSGLGIITSWVPMAFAILLTEVRSPKFKRLVQTFTTIPNFISWVLVYAIAFAIFSSDGFVNTLLTNLTGTKYSHNYLNDADLSWVKMLLWGMWKGTGWSAIIYLSGIAGIDQQLYEAATMDGAGRFRRIWHITIPGLLPTFVVMLVMSIAGILSNGMDQYLVFSNASNIDYLNVLDLYVYKLGIDSGNIPLSTVVGMSKSLISIALLFVANTASKWIRGSSVV